VEAIVVSVRREGDIGHARRAAASTAGEMGFSPLAVEQIAVVVTELATNLVQHHTIDGQIIIRMTDGCARPGLEIVAEDQGPGIASLHQATQDHWSSRGTMGCGLGAVQRLMDTFDIESHPISNTAESDTPAFGTRVTVRKWVENGEQPHRFNYSANSRPYPGETENGDAFFIQEDNDGVLVAVADGLGHGSKAAIASRRAIETVRQNVRSELEPLLGVLHRKLTGTRGAAITLVRIDLEERKLAHIGIGNVATRVYPTGTSQLVTLPGVVGMGELDRPRLNCMTWPKDGTLIVFSDGISAKWDPSDEATNWDNSVTVIGHNLMKAFGRSNDDATVLVVREAD